MAAAANPISRMFFRYFRPSIIGWLALALLLPLFISLGNWQMGKAQTRLARQQLLDQRLAGPQLDVTDVHVPLADVEFRPVAVNGRYLPAQQFLLDNQVMNEAAGYKVMTPLQLDAGGFVLVDRGWVAAGRDRADVPKVPVPDAPAMLEGLAVAFPRAGLQLAGASNQGPVHASIDPAELASRLGGPLAGWMLVLKPGRPDALAVEWPHPAERVQTNIGYAWQWYGFAFATVVIFLVVSWRRARALEGAT